LHHRTSPIIALNRLADKSIRGEGRILHPSCLGAAAFLSGHILENHDIEAERGRPCPHGVQVAGSWR